MNMHAKVKTKRSKGLPAGKLLAVLLSGLVVMAGCSDPTAVGRFRATPVTNIILDSLGVVDENPPQFAYAREPHTTDLIADESEYVIQAGDLLDISIMDLFASGMEWRNRLQVSDTGRITVPEVGTIRVAGRTELEATGDIKSMLSPHVIKDPTISVVVIASTEKVFSISGAVGAAGRYQLSQPDFRILEAIAQAGGIPQSGVDYAYVVRKVGDDDIAVLEQQLASYTSQQAPPVMGPPSATAMTQRGKPFYQEKLAPTPPGTQPPTYPMYPPADITQQKLLQPPPQVPEPGRVPWPQGVEPQKQQIPVYQQPWQPPSVGPQPTVPPGQWPGQITPPEKVEPKGYEQPPGPEVIPPGPKPEPQETTPIGPGPQVPPKEDVNEKESMLNIIEPTQAPLEPIKPGTIQPPIVPEKEEPTPAETEPQETPSIPEIIIEPVQPPMEPVPPPKEPIQPPSEPVQPPPEPVQPPLEPIKPPTDTVQPPVEPVKPPTEPEQPPVVEPVEPPKEPVQPPVEPEEAKITPIEETEQPEPMEEPEQAEAPEEPEPEADKELTPEEERKGLLESIKPIAEILTPVEMADPVTTPPPPEDLVNDSKIVNIYYGNIGNVNNYAGQGPAPGPVSPPQQTNEHKEHPNDKPENSVKKPDPKEGPEEGHPSEEKTEEKDIKEGQKEVHEAEKETLPEQEIKVIEKEDKEAVPEKEMMPEAKAGKKKTGGALKVIRRDGRFQLVPVTEAQEAATEESSEMTWRYPQYPAEPTPTPPAPRPARYQQAMAAPMPERPQPQVGPAAWDRYPGQRQEVIRIDLKALQSGDMRQNIVIRPGDYIQVPYNDVGIFYVMGQVSRPGPYSLQGERMTLKQAMTVAGPMSPLADLTQCDITRRIGKDREVTCRINLKKLMEGSQPDVFIKPQDIVNVGSHPLARWIAVIRQSFRTTYGFGFVYDRNLADKDFGH